ncbi:MAG: hypothetical protein CMJ18_20095 [Phycisphaeraceae bacterium]|nr:hypothetical protein [Phycisphaeraceae bacterium]
MDRGRHLRVYWDDPTGGRARLYQLALRVRRYHEYADVEVDVKMIVANAEKPRYLREEDVLEGNVDLLEDFIDQQICRFARLYSAERAFDD